MNIEIILNDDIATVVLDGRLTVATSVDFEDAIRSIPESFNKFIVDMSKLEYLSSAGLRVLVKMDRVAMERGGSVVIVHASELVLEVFEMTGLSEIFTVQAD